MTNSPDFSTLRRQHPTIPFHTRASSVFSRCLFIALALLLTTTTSAPAETNKGQFNLFNPTPNELMRDLSPDRPDGTESPRTVDAGHFAIELSIVDWSHDSETDTDTLTFFDTNLKIGLTNDIDLQLVFQAYGEERTDLPGGGVAEANGFADVQLRLKVNLWGNDPVDQGGKVGPQLFGIDTAVGVMPFIQIPTGTELSSEHVEGGFIVMLGLDVADNWGIGLMAEFDGVYDGGDDNYDFEFVHTAVVGFDVVGPVGMYVEYIGSLSTDGDVGYQASFSGGVTYEFNSNFVLDAGLRAGLTNDVEDIVLFTGFTLRY